MSDTKQQCPQLHGNLLDRWDMMANDTKDYLREQDENFCASVEAFRNFGWHELWPDNDPEQDKCYECGGYHVGGCHKAASQPSPAVAPSGAREWLTKLTDEDWEIARKFHEAYERLAPTFGYKTRKESAKPWSDVPISNKQLMAATVHEVAESLTAPLREQVAKLQDQLKTREGCSMPIMRDCPTHGESKELAAERTKREAAERELKELREHPFTIRGVTEFLSRAADHVADPPNTYNGVWVNKHAQDAAGILRGKIYELAALRGKGE